MVTVLDLQRTIGYPPAMLAAEPAQDPFPEHGDTDPDRERWNLRPPGC